MKDYTVGVNELRDHYNQLRLFKKSVRSQVKMEYEAKIDFEVKSRTEAAELKFANHLAAVKERDDMPVRILQDEVLRTRTWSVWERIRDLAGVQPEFVKAEDARALKRLAAQSYHWSDDFSTLTITRTSTGDELENAVIFPASSIRIRNGQYSAVSENERYELAALKAEANAKDYFRMLDTAIREQIEAGNIDNPEEGD